MLYHSLVIFNFFTEDSPSSPMRDPSERCSVLNRFLFIKGNGKLPSPDICPIDLLPKIDNGTNYLFFFGL